MPGIRPVFGTINRLSTFEANLANLASNIDLLNGTCSEIIDVSATPVLDVIVQGSARLGTTITSGRSLGLYVIAQVNDAPTWPTGVTPGAALNFASTDARANSTVFASMSYIPVTTNNADYGFKPFSIASLFMGVLPRRFLLWLAQNSNANLNASGHRFEWYTQNMETY